MRRENGIRSEFLFIHENNEECKITVSHEISNTPVQIYKKDTLIIFSLPIISFQTEVKLLLYTIMFVDNNNNPNTIIRIKIFGNYIRSQKCDKYIFPPKSPISPLCLHYTEIK